MHDDIGHRPELLAFSSLNLIQPEMPRLTFHPRAIPLCEEGFLGASRLAPTYAVPDGRVTDRHRLAIDADLLSERALLGSATCETLDAPARAG